MQDLRAEPRQAVTLPVQLDRGVIGLTRDISPMGIYVQIRAAGRAALAVGPAAYRVGQQIIFELPSADGHLVFRAEGEIVRVDRHDEVVGFAVRLDSESRSILIADGAGDPTPAIRLITR